ncbi:MULTISPECIES: DUF4177 domain-containing protein [Heyndrickxia]|jgi:hypothetical protein|uniref:DUF4177 domain-containing protein n=1 Tax=Heyndrickxia oleronia TaxID=38875 RepID=A0A8E2I5B3_9BACI|nr:DUF4177 domain-containing protein [Heyndrickxia oleronia]NYV65337.1 DUF4177 domain-containing protein [Bacillus sp. Gen3]OJH20101.1 hypothetical protein BLX88_03090 [Bacillus obstructivus]MBU5212928.1 DUF4177 domain-containing protein [Heyndrickxia oleronia]MCI1591790.1 DUF4177 domain-containing protein [Heyndrickxia oleronia]MCI1615046.1 DUF4177 domain-containing protein [Heyndrickxia oleronia]
MYEYKFETIPVGALNGKPKKDYQAIIHENAREGWKLLQIVTPPFGGAGQALTMELIFEKKID